MRRWVLVFTFFTGAAFFAGAAACTSFKSGGEDSDGGNASSSGSGSGGTSSGSSSGSSTSGGSSGASSSGGSTSSGSSSSGSSGGSTSSGGGLDGGSVDGSATATGPGPYGALPSGYCCTADTDCRNRRCADLGGGNKMCEDECDGFPAICTGVLPGLTCVADDGGVSSYCMPAAAGAACVAADQYVHGSKPTGACCTPANDGTIGRECAGGNCGSTGAGNNPYICANACDNTQPCTGEFQCQNVADYNLCIPVNPATCTQ